MTSSPGVLLLGRRATFRPTRCGEAEDEGRYLRLAVLICGDSDGDDVFVSVVRSMISADREGPARELDAMVSAGVNDCSTTNSVLCFASLSTDEALNKLKAIIDVTDRRP